MQVGAHHISLSGSSEMTSKMTLKGEVIRPRNASLSTSSVFTFALKLPLPEVHARDFEAEMIDRVSRCPCPISTRLYIYGANKYS